MNITNVPSGTEVYGPSGEILTLRIKLFCRLFGSVELIKVVDIDPEQVLANGIQAQYLATVLSTIPP